MSNTCSCSGGLRLKSRGLHGKHVHRCMIIMKSEVITYQIIKQHISFMKHYKGVPYVISHVFPVHCSEVMNSQRFTLLPGSAGKHVFFFCYYSYSEITCLT